MILNQIIDLFFRKSKNFTYLQQYTRIILPVALFLLSIKKIWFMHRHVDGIISDLPSKIEYI